MRVLVSGATGKLGPHVVSALCERGVRVTALVRQPDRAQRVVPTSVGDAARAKGLSAWEAGHLTEMLHLFRTGAAGAVTDDLPRLLGRPARSVAGFVSGHRELFAT